MPNSAPTNGSDECTFGGLKRIETKRPASVGLPNVAHGRRGRSSWAFLRGEMASARFLLECLESLSLVPHGGSRVRGPSSPFALRLRHRPLGYRRATGYHFTSAGQPSGKPPAPTSPLRTSQSLMIPRRGGSGDGSAPLLRPLEKTSRRLGRGRCANVTGHCLNRLRPDWSARGAVPARCRP